MIEDIFLAYANFSMRNHPENLYKIFSVIEKNMQIDLEGVDIVIKMICDFSIWDDPEDFLGHLPEDAFGSGIGFSSYEQLAVEGTTGRRGAYYEFLKYLKKKYKNNPKKLKQELKIHEEYRKPSDHKCDIRGLKRSFLPDEDLCEESLVLKCYECHQLGFVGLLKEIVNGKEYSEIEDIDSILFESSIISIQKTDRLIQKSNERTPFKETLQAKSFFLMGLNEFIRSEYGNVEQQFNVYLNFIALFSLTEFLLHNDRRKLKQCRYCDRFFRAKNIKRKTRCYEPECEKAYQRDKKRKQREEDPGTYY